MLLPRIPNFVPRRLRGHPYVVRYLQPLLALTDETGRNVYRGFIVLTRQVRTTFRTEAALPILPGHLPALDELRARLPGEAVGRDDNHCDSDGSGSPTAN